MTEKKVREENRQSPKNERLVESVDYYFENGLMVLTAHFLKRRGYCCGNGCRHCPYETERSE
jgi:hypothetical protein